MPARNGLNLAGVRRDLAAARLRIVNHLSTACDLLVYHASASHQSLSCCIRPDAKDRAKPCAFARKLLIPSAVSCTLAVAGCASQSVSPEPRLVSSAPSAPEHRRFGPAIHRSDRALLASQRAPDCEFKSPERDAVDADLLARLKLDYERHCYQQAEMLVRNRLRLLQNSATSPSEPAANAGVAKGVPLPSPQLLEHQSKPNCEIPPSDPLPGAMPERAQLIYERECYKNAETVVRTKLQLLQDAIASTTKALNDAAASRTLQPAEGGEQGAPAPAKDAAIAPKAGASAAKSSEVTGTAGDRRDAKSDPSGDQGVEPPDQHRKPTPSARLSVKPSSREGVACQTSKPAGHGSWAWRLIDGRKCWYEGAVGMDKSLLHWPPL
jgi:hypothetical protein